MELFLCDLDNTLIYSYKKEIGLNKQLVETKKEKALSYMTAYSFKKMEQVIKEYCFIPITTRSLEQYRRINFPSNWRPDYALVANGGILLYKNEIEDNWYTETQEIIQKAKQQLQQAISLLKQDSNVTFDICLVDNCFVFTKSKDTEQTKRQLEKQLDLQKVLIISQYSKLYILPRNLQKDGAAERICQFLGYKQYICAGDSLFDIPMLSKAKLAILPEELEETYSFSGAEKKKVIPNSKLFSDGIMETLLSSKLFSL